MAELEGSVFECCWRRRLDGLKDCLARGQPVDERNDNGITPLQICAALGWTEAASLLLTHGADVHLANPLGWTALMQAARNGHTDLVKILLKAGARLTDRNCHGWDVISLAVASQDEVLLTTLTQMVDGSDLRLSVITACELGRFNALLLLLNKKVDINWALPVSGVTPLMLAASEGHRDIVRTLLSCAAEPGVVNSSGLKALDMAAIAGHNVITAMLSPNVKPRCAVSPTLTIPRFLQKTASQHSSNGIPYHPCTSYWCASEMNQPSPEVFKFPPSPTCPCSRNPSPCMLSLKSPYSHVSPVSAYPVSPSWCGSPSFPPSPMIPPWMFTHQHCFQKREPKITVKRQSLIKNWWKKLKRRYHKRKSKKGIKVYVTFEENRAATDNQFEDLLRSLDLKSLFPLLKSQEIDVETFQHLRDKDLEELGIVDRALQISILQKISALNGNILNCSAL